MCRGAEAGIFPISDSSGLILSRACRKGWKGCCKPNFIISGSPNRGRRRRGANRREKQRRWRRKGVV